MASVAVKLPVGMLDGQRGAPGGVRGQHCGRSSKKAVAVEPRLKPRIFREDGRMWAGVFLNARNIKALDGLEPRSPTATCLPWCRPSPGAEAGMSDESATKRLEDVALVTAVRGRASVRRFLPDPVPRDDVRAMVTLAVRAANASNAQPWRFVAVDDVETQVAMRRAVDDALDEMATWPELAERRREIEALRAYATFFVDAPLVMAVFAVPYASRGDEMLIARGLRAEERDRLRARPDLQSIGAAVQLLCTAAHALGYGSCWMTAPVLAAPVLETLLRVEAPARLVAVVPIGRPAGAATPSSRRPVEEVLEFR